MIRRSFWLAVGAAAGIMGYRRAAEVGRQVSSTLGVTQRRPPGTRRRWARETLRFSRDVREGMDLYMARHPDSRGPSLDLSEESRR